MKKITQQRALVCASFCVLSVAGRAQEVTKPQNPLKPAQVDRASYPKNPHLVALEPRLPEAVLALQPNAGVEFVANYLIVSYRSEDFREHVIDFRGNISKEPSQQFPDNFSEFLLYLNVDKDIMYYRASNPLYRKNETFGTTLFDRYNLKSLSETDQAIGEQVVPSYHWAYVEYDKLVKANLLPNRYPGGFHMGAPREITRYEFAAAIAHLLDNPDKKAELAANNNLDVKNAITALQSEFSAEISGFGLAVDFAKPTIKGLTWQPRYEHLSLRFSYGKGVDAALVEKIRETIADYAKQSSQLNTAANNVPALK